MAAQSSTVCGVQFRHKKLGEGEEGGWVRPLQIMLNI